MVGGVRSVHRRAGVFMESTKQPTLVTKGITAAYYIKERSESLLPNRKDPTGPDLCRQILKTPESTGLGAKQLNWRDPLSLCLGAMFALSESTGFRKSEVALPNGEAFDDRRLRRA